MSKSLDFEKIKEKLGKPITTKDALKDVTPIKWDEDVLSGKKKITVSKGD